MRLDWLIIGGGIHGVHAAHVLVDGRGWATRWPDDYPVWQIQPEGQ